MIVSLPPFQHLVDAHWRDVARLSHALAGADAAEDVAQQAWTQAIAAYPRLTHARNLRSWLLTITHRCAMDHHRTARRTTPVEDPGALLEHALPAGQTDHVGGFVSGEGLWRQVAALPERQRSALVLRFVGDLDHRAIAETLGTSPAMSRRLVSDGVATLRQSAADLEDLR